MTNQGSGAHRDSISKKDQPNPRIGRSDHLQEPGPSYQQALREDSSVSRGRTRRREDEYTNPPRNLAAYESSSGEELIYSDGRGSYLPRSVLTGQAPPPAPGSYLSKMTEERDPRTGVRRARPTYEDVRQNGYRQQAAEIERENRISQQRSPEHTLMPMRVVESRSSRNGRSGGGNHRSRGRKRKSEEGCCIIL